MSLRKITKNRGSFPSDDALLKLSYLALAYISKKWTVPLRDWKAALTRFTIQFGERMLKTKHSPHLHKTRDTLSSGKRAGPAIITGLLRFWGALTSVRVGWFSAVGNQK
jgi:hypothetical protein